LARVNGLLFLRLDIRCPGARQARIREVDLNPCLACFGLGLQRLCALVVSSGNGFVDLAIPVMQRFKTQ